MRDVEFSGNGNQTDSSRAKNTEHQKTSEGNAGHFPSQNLGNNRLVVRKQVTSAVEACKQSLKMEVFIEILFKKH